MLRVKKWIGCGLLVTLALTGCGGDVALTPTPTTIPSTATLPPLPPTLTPEPIPPTNTPLPIPTAIKLNCTNKVANARDVNVPDNTVFKPGTAFTKTWRIKNAGTCPWIEGYQLVFVAGDRMEGKQAVPVPATNPGADADISINLIAPFATGKYKGYWLLRDITGKDFGTGDTANIPWWVAITVKK